MSIHPSDVSRCLEGIASASNDDSYRTTMQVATICLSSVPGSGTTIFNESLEMAKAYWLSSSGNEADMWSMNEACWRFIDQNYPAGSPEDKSYVLVRAVLCLLYPACEEVEELFDWFCAMLNRLGDYRDELFQACETVVGKGFPD